jgi:streptomycin 6-kinase
MSASSQPWAASDPRAIIVSSLLAAALRDLGTAGTDWLAGLPDQVAGLAADWSLTVGAALEGGNTSYVAQVVTHDGMPAVLKVALPPGIEGFVPFGQQLAALQRVGGDPYVRLLRHDAPRRAFLLERLGTPLGRLGWSVSRQLDTLVHTAARAWRPVRADEFPTEATKARWFRDYVASAWEELGRPCPEAVAERAIRCATAREAAFDPRRSVLVHGDAHPFNLLRVPGSAGGFRLIDPEGVVGDPALELGVILRNLKDNLADRTSTEARMIMTRYCRRAGRLAGVDPEAVWQWLFVQRVAGGLHALRIGDHDESERTLAGIGKLVTG